MPSAPEQHARHDRLLVAALAAGDLAGADRDRAAVLVRDCRDCRTLHDDLISIARATAALPAAVRPRDFQLTDEQAARLGAPGWRRLVGAFAGPRLAVTRQLGVGLTTLGIAGLLLSAVPSLPFAAGGAASAPSAAQQELYSTGASADGAPAVSAPAASPAPSAAAPAPTGPAASGSSERAGASPSDPIAAQGAQETPDRDMSGGGAGIDERLQARDAFAAADGFSLLAAGSAVALIAGLALLVVRAFARRIAAG